MKITQIYIGNVLESYYKQHKKLSPKERDFWVCYDALENTRSLLYGTDNKCILTPAPIAQYHLDYIKKLTGWKNALNLYPEKICDSISLEIKNNKTLNNKVISIIKSNPNVELIPYRQTAEFYELISYLKGKNLKFRVPETMLAEKKFVESYFHTKRGFRHLWEIVKNPQLKIEIPEGFIVEDINEAIKAGWWFFKQQKDFVIKYNRGVQGIGVAFFSSKALPKDEINFVKAITALLKEELWNSSCLVVEEKVDVDIEKLGGSPNVELRIDNNGKVHREYSCEQVLAPDRKTFEGIRIHPLVHKNKHIETAFKAGELFGRQLSKLGYRGIFELDLVVSKMNKLYAVESNLRRNGGTHIHEFCKTLLGKNYPNNYWVHSQDLPIKNKLKPAKSKDNKEKSSNSQIVQQLYEHLDTHLYNQQTKTGLVIVNPDLIQCGILPLLFIEKNEKALETLIGKVKQELENL